MSLFSFLNLSEYEQLIEHHLPTVFLWQIRQMELKPRLAAIKTYSCFLKIKDLAEAKGIKFKEAEALSWLDNIVIIKRLIERFNNQERASISLDLEYELIPSKKRIDCLLSYTNKYFIIECSYCENVALITSELKQAASYKKDLTKKFKDIIVDCDILAFKPEYSQSKLKLETNIEYNESLLDNLTNEIKSFFVL